MMLLLVSLNTELGSEPGPTECGKIKLKQLNGLAPHPPIHIYMYIYTHTYISTHICVMGRYVVC